VWNLSSFRFTQKFGPILFASKQTQAEKLFTKLGACLHRETDVLHLLTQLLVEDGFLNVPSPVTCFCGPILRKADSSASTILGTRWKT
jgi:hypothetical protein